MIRKKAARVVTWPMMLVEPKEIMRPTNTESPLKASLCEPGRYGLTSENSGGSSFRIAFIVSSCESPRNARRPVSIS